MDKKPVKYVAQLSHVREVTLIGAADLAFWKERLEGERLEPVPSGDGLAQVLIVGADSRFNGVRFREVSVSIVARTLDLSPAIEGAWLAQAFNSVRFFAWVERAIFKTPYDHADVEISVGPPARFSVSFGQELAIDARMNGAFASQQAVAGGWRGPVFLPSAKAFYAKIEGITATLPFTAAHDEVTVHPTSGIAMKDLAASNYEPRQWQIREDASHAKSKTYRRDELPKLATCS